MTVVHLFDPPDRFVAGTVGMPGHRTFFLQARAGARVVAVACEKQQVAILADRMQELLNEVMAVGSSPIDNEPLEQPIMEEFRAGTITLSWDSQSEQVVIEVFPFRPPTGDPPEEVAESGLLDLPLEEPEPEELLVVRMSAAMARGFATRADAVVGQGRAVCPFCGGPVDVDGHLCPRTNGYRRSS